MSEAWTPMTVTIKRKMARHFEGLGALQIYCEYTWKPNSLGIHNTQTYAAQ